MGDARGGYRRGRLEPFANQIEVERPATMARVEVDSGCLPDNGGRIAATLSRSPLLFAGMNAEEIAAV